MGDLFLSPEVGPLLALALLAKRLGDVFFVCPKTFGYFCSPERLSDFYCLKRLDGFFCPERLGDFFLSREVG